MRTGITYQTYKEGEGERGVSMDSSCWNGHTAKWLPNASMMAHLPSGSTLTTGRQSLCKTPPYNRQKFSRAHMYMCIYIYMYLKIHLVFDNLWWWHCLPYPYILILKLMHWDGLESIGFRIILNNWQLYNNNK